MIAPDGPQQSRSSPQDDKSSGRCSNDGGRGLVTSRNGAKTEGRRKVEGVIGMTPHAAAVGARPSPIVLASINMCGLRDAQKGPRKQEELRQLTCDRGQDHAWPQVNVLMIQEVGTISAARGTLTDEVLAAWRPELATNVCPGGLCYITKQVMTVLHRMGDVQSDAGSYLDGRLLIVHVWATTAPAMDTYYVNSYAPGSSEHRSRQRYYDSACRTLKTAIPPGAEVVWGGDNNVVIDIDKDATGAPDNPGATELRNMMEQCGLTEPLTAYLPERHTHNHAVGERGDMTWERDGVYRRMDFWMVSKAVLPYLNTADIRRSVQVHHPWFQG
jgi:exonuclease III